MLQVVLQLVVILGRQSMPPATRSWRSCQLPGKGTLSRLLLVVILSAINQTFNCSCLFHSVCVCVLNVILFPHLHVHFGGN